VQSSESRHFQLDLGQPRWAVSSTLNRLGLALEDEQRYVEAEASFQQALEIREALYGPRSPTLVAILRNLARVYTEEGKKKEAATARYRANHI